MIEQITSLIKLAELRVEQATIRLQKAITDEEEAEQAVVDATKNAERVATDVVTQKAKMRKEMADGAVTVGILESYRVSNIQLNDEVSAVRELIGAAQQNLVKAQEVVAECRADFLAAQRLLEKRSQLLQRLQRKEIDAQEIAEELELEESSAQRQYYPGEA